MKRVFQRRKVKGCLHCGSSSRKSVLRAEQENKYIQPQYTVAMEGPREGMPRSQPPTVHERVDPRVVFSCPVSLTSSDFKEGTWTF